MAKEEQVLVVKREVLEQIGMFQGLTVDVDAYLESLFAPGVLHFMSRSQAEKDPSHKQLIPYVMLTYEGKYWSYVRGQRSRESRLVGKRSVGVGGHINPGDDVGSPREMYLAAVEREIAEEVFLDTGHDDQVVCLLNDDSTEVGQVHLGVVHQWILDSPSVRPREQIITETGFMSLSELRKVRDTLETWSALIIDQS